MTVMAQVIYAYSSVGGRIEATVSDHIAIGQAVSTRNRAGGGGGVGQGRCR